MSVHDDEPRLFGEAVVALGLATRQQVHDALDAQVKLSLLGVVKRIGELLRDHGVLTGADVARVLDHLAAERGVILPPVRPHLDWTDEEQHLLAETVVRNRLVASEELEECANIQRKAGEMGVNISLAQVLLEKGYLTPRTMAAVEVLVARQSGPGAVDVEPQPDPYGDESFEEVFAEGDGSDEVRELDRAREFVPDATAAVQTKIKRNRVERAIEELTTHRPSDRVEDERLGRILIRNRIIDAFTLERALDVQKRLAAIGLHRKLGEVLVDKKILDEETVAAALTIQDTRHMARRLHVPGTVRWIAYVPVFAGLSVLFLLVLSLVFLARRPGSSPESGETPARAAAGDRVEKSRTGAATAPEREGDSEVARRLARGLVFHRGRWMMSAERDRLEAAETERTLKAQGWVLRNGEWVAPSVALAHRKRRDGERREGGSGGGRPGEIRFAEIDAAGNVKVSYARQESAALVKVAINSNLPAGTVLMVSLGAPGLGAAREKRWRLSGPSGLLEWRLPAPLFPGRYDLEFKIDSEKQDPGVRRRFAAPSFLATARAPVRVGDAAEAVRLLGEGETALGEVRSQLEVLLGEVRRGRAGDLERRIAAGKARLDSLTRSWTAHPLAPAAGLLSSGLDALSPRPALAAQLPGSDPVRVIEDLRARLLAELLGAWPDSSRAVSEALRMGNLLLAQLAGMPRTERAGGSPRASETLPPAPSRLRLHLWIEELERILASRHDLIAGWRSARVPWLVEVMSASGRWLASPPRTPGRLRAAACDACLLSLAFWLRLAARHGVDTRRARRFLGRVRASGTLPVLEALSAWKRLVDGAGAARSVARDGVRQVRRLLDRPPSSAVHGRLVRRLEIHAARRTIADLERSGALREAVSVLSEVLDGIERLAAPGGPEASQLRARLKEIERRG